MARQRCVKCGGEVRTTAGQYPGLCADCRGPIVERREFAVTLARLFPDRVINGLRPQASAFADGGGI